MARKREAPKGKKMKPTYFVFCEGKTEELYVKFLKNQYRVPIIIDSKVAKNRVDEKYIKSYKKAKFTHKKDKTFLLYDLDAPKMLQKLQSINSAILLASNPCIELWYLLHFKEQTANICCAECNRELQKRVGIYSKVNIDSKLKEILINGQQKAINRAKKLDYYKNPSSTVYQFIEFLEGVKLGANN